MGEEIWDGTDDDNDAANVDMNQVDDHVENEKVLLGISLFLYFFQLTYHISERAMTTLHLFVKLLLTYVMGLIGGNTILNFLSNSIPKSMCTIRKLINMKQAIKEYVVCPKCDRLYDLSDCIIVENGQERSKLCEFIKFPRHRQTSHRSKCNTMMNSVIVGGKKKLVPRKSFFYHSVIHGLESLLATKFFYKSVNIGKHILLQQEHIMQIFMMVLYGAFQ